MLVVPVADAERAADLCALASVVADVVPVDGVGSVAVVAPGSAEASAQAVSKLLRVADVLVLTTTQDAVAAQRWRGGARQEDPRAGLLLATWPDDVQRLLLGRLAPAEVAGTASSAGRSRWRALRSLARARRR